MSTQIIEEYYENDAAGIKDKLVEYIGAYGSTEWTQFWTFIKEAIDGRGRGEVDDLCIRYK